MKCIISCLLFIIAAIGTTQAQSEFETLLKTQQQYQVDYAKEPKRTTRRKLHKAEEQLISYLKEEGYELKVALHQVTALPIHGQSYPALGEVVDSLKNEQTIKVFGKDKYGYYKVLANEKIGYVYKLDQYLAGLNNYPMAVVDKYTAIEARVDAILSKPMGNNQAVYSSAPCQAINHSGQRCGIMNRNASGNCHLH